MAQFSKTAWIANLKKKTKGGSDWKKARTKEAVAKGGQLPGGITKGVAQLTGYKIEFDKKGNPYVSFNFTAHEPSEVSGVKFSVQHFISEGKDPKTGEVFKTVGDAVDGLVNDMKLLASDEMQDSITSAEIEELPDILKALAAEKPFTEFNTWKPNARPGQKGEPRVKVYLQGKIDYTPEEGAPTGDDNSGKESNDDSGEEEESSEGIEVGSTVEHAKHGVCEVTAVDEETGTVKIKTAEGKVFAKVKPDALALVVTEEEEENDSEEEEESTESEETSEEEWEPKKKEEYNFKPGPKAKPSRHEVVGVNKKNQTVDLKDSKGKLFKGIGWDKLLDAS